MFCPFCESHLGTLVITLNGKAHEQGGKADAWELHRVGVSIMNLGTDGI